MLSLPEGYHLRNLRWLWLMVLVVVLDLVTKAWVSESLTYAQPVYVLPVFDLTLLHNTGAAFSFLAAAGGWQRWLFAAIAVVVSVVILLWMMKLSSKQYWHAVALALILGGALGNLHDRILLGYVVDFLSFHYNGWFFPAFNLADSAITLGALMLIPDMLGFKGAGQRQQH
ncbi:signal peptidase [Pokkaliibacter plantistimulans]|uniref:Lipoprotein signal peptidase n=1 Tax=Pokkaliibacter plantistimulans TaxID=1635171 RepID=A0ABX5LVI0_9GAMM|nr:signal peptidase II [Pokkaliibacter plantistimulans]PXF30164.1 signal peptidase [Pokkaliibacter plantistimulans]